MISAFGPRAVRYARGLDRGLNLILTEPEFIGAAYVEAVAQRERGVRFYGMVLFDDRRAALAGSVAAQILHAVGDHDSRLAHMLAYAHGKLPIDGQPSRDVWSAIAPEISKLAPEFFGLADAMLVRSFAEAERWRTFLRRLRPFERVLCEPTIPDVSARASGPAVVVWGPGEPAQSLAVPVLGLGDYPGPVTVVCAGGSLPGFSNVDFLDADHPAVAAALEAAAVVVCPDVADPGPAVAFARRGYGVTATATSAAAEFIADVAVYDPAAPRSVLDAVGIALARPVTPLPPMPALPPIPPAPAEPVARDRLPLVSVVIITYNRPDDLERALACASAQTYPNLEILVVNDAGVPAEDVVAAFPRARLHNQPQNMGVDAALIAAFARVRGEYLQMLADDDALYPDHVERLVFAMLRCGAGAAHSNTLIRYQKRKDDGTFVTSGFNAEVFNWSTTATEALIATPIAGQGVMFRRDVFEAVGGWTDKTFLSDQELQMRLWQQCPVVWVDHVTSEWRSREKGLTFSTMVDSGPELRRVYDLHPVAHRPLLEKLRDLTVERISARARGEGFAPTLVLTPVG